MTRDQAAARIRREMGFRPSGTSLDSVIVDCLQEAQRDLEKGKTLPRFLLAQDQTLTLSDGEHFVDLPDDFLRESDETRIRFFSDGSSIPTFLSRKYYIDAVQGNLHGNADQVSTEDPVAPSVYVVRIGKSFRKIDFITTADTDYTLYWDYYAAADVLDSGDVENDWLADGAGAMWLVGEAGIRAASPTRDTNAVSVFTSLRDKGRAACFGEDLASETASGPIQMGGNL